MRIDLNQDDLRPLIESVVAETLTAVEGSAINGDDRLAYTEPEAASLLGINSNQLRDARLRGEIVGTKVGGRIGYEKSELVAYLRRGRN